MTFQHEFSQAVFDPARSVPDGLVDPRSRPAGKRFDVYRNNVVVSLIKAAEEAFPVLLRLIGEQNFRAMAAAFVRAHPPESPLMMYFGQKMPTFLEGFAPLGAYPYMTDIARLELALRRSYHAADADPIAPDALSELAPEALMASTFTLAPSLQVIRSDWPIHGIWAMNMAGGPNPAPRAEDVVILRAEFDPEPHLLPPGGGAFLTALQSGQTLETAVDAGSQVTGFSLADMLALLLSGGAITSIMERISS